MYFIFISPRAYHIVTGAKFSIALVNLKIKMSAESKVSHNCRAHVIAS